jgi:tRNA 2-thiouridine synthesizing protein A
MSKQVDATGLSCPEPLIMATKAFKELQGDSFEVWVDNEVSKENVSRVFREKYGVTVEVFEEEDRVVIKITK